MEQDDSYAWNRTTVMAGICESVCGKFSSCNTNPTTFMHIRTSKFVCILQISLITFKLQGPQRTKKKKKKKHICTMGKKESNLFKGTPSLEEGLVKNNFMKFESLLWVLSTNPQSASLG